MAKLLNRLKRIMDHKHRRALFILKRRHDYTEAYGEKHLATGMYNSAKLVSDMLEDAGIDSKVVIVVDNNDIDREVSKYKPTHVFIEGIWVVPEKFDVLKPLHRKVKWIVRCHSEIPFLAQEGNAIDWIFEYIKRGVYVAGNSSRVNATLQSLVGDALDLDQEVLNEMVPLLPNYYPVDDDFVFQPREAKSHFDIGCFGAIRPLKNQLMQAIAAVEFAKAQGKGLKFHINSARIEQNGNNQLKNIRALFNQLDENFQLVEHGWLHPKDFKKFLRKMDICMQVSFSETFNIVSADAVDVGTPIVVSPEITWAPQDTWAKPTDIDSIVDTMEYVWEQRDTIVEEALEGLEKYSDRSKHLWTRYIKTH